MESTTFFGFRQLPNEGIAKSCPNIRHLTPQLVNAVSIERIGPWQCGWQGRLLGPASSGGGQLNGSISTKFQLS